MIQISNAIDVNVLDNPFEWGWNAVNAIGALLAAVAAMASLFFFILQYLSENRPTITVIEEDKKPNESKKKFILKNTGNRTAVEIMVAGTFPFYKEVLPPGQTFPFEDYNGSCLKEISYRRYRWSRKLYERKNRTKKENKGIDRIESFEGRLKLRRLLKRLLKEMPHNALIEVLQQNGLLTITASYRDEYENRFESSIATSSEFITVHFILTKMLQLDAPITIEHGEFSSFDFHVGQTTVKRAFRKNLSIFRLIWKQKYRGVYFSTQNAITVLAGICSPHVMSENFKISKDKEDHLIFLFESSRRETALNKMAVKGLFFSETPNAVVISFSEFNFIVAAHSKYPTHDLTILDKTTKTLYSSAVTKFNNVILSDEQVEGFLQIVRKLHGKKRAKQRFSVRLKIQTVFKAIVWRAKFI